MLLLLSGWKCGRLIVPCSSRRARPEGVWRRIGRGFGRGEGEVEVWGGLRGWGWMGIWGGGGFGGCDGIVRLVVEAFRIVVW